MDENSSTTTLTRQCNFDFLIMHVVPIQGIKPQHIEHKYTPRASSPQLKEQNLTGHQALNVLSINKLPGHQALNLKSKSSQGTKPST
ncbi:hypothetical protein MTR_1662s0010 [Medicago truncatula]|uniref:Uncharacterized protein n=1 Tax=Medicago truncatula TaxID=3880 RepID=A0A072TNT8_MEDTR|nr:hypothetical protein MTR_1662s0010 [Medicago truncatula]